MRVRCHFDYGIQRNPQVTYGEKVKNERIASKTKDV